VALSSLRPRAVVALAVIAAVLGPAG
jgi:hypothetical protein